MTVISKKEMFNEKFFEKIFVIEPPKIYFFFNLSH